jgi:hypothetical protein
MTDIEQARELLAMHMRAVAKKHNADGLRRDAEVVESGKEWDFWMEAAHAAVVAALRVAPEGVDPFAPKWPTGLQQDHVYQLPCDDKGRSNANWLQVYVAQDSDVHVMMQDWEDILEKGSSPNPLPTLRVRTYFGGGRNHRTHQALLWLAQAIRLDMEEKAATPELATVAPPRNPQTKLGDVA